MADNTTALGPTAPIAPRDIFDVLHRNVDRLFEDFNGAGALRSFAPAAAAFVQGKLSPRINVSDTNGVIEVTAELPGLEVKDVNVHLDDGALTISGEKTSETQTTDKNLLYAERAFGSFLRRIPLPAGIDASSISASMKQGVLTVTIAKPASAQPTKIEVKPAS